MEKDTIDLLQECNSGCKMATSSIEQVLPCISNKAFEKMIDDYNKQHIALGDEAHKLLNEHRADEKDPHPVAKAMSWITTEAKLTIQGDQKHIAKLLMDGCNMGIQSISEHKHKFKEANRESVDLADRLVKLEEDFMVDLKKYL